MRGRGLPEKLLKSNVFGGSSSTAQRVEDAVPRRVSQNGTRRERVGRDGSRVALLLGFAGPAKT